MAEKLVNGSGTRNDSCGADKKSEVAVILGAQWGDEGKGKIVDLLCQRADVVCRCQVFWCLLLAGRLARPVVLT